MPKTARKKTKKIKKRKRVTSEQLRRKLKLKHLKSKQSFSKKHSHVEKYLKGKGVEVAKIRKHSAKVIGASVLTGALLATPQSKIKGLPDIGSIIEEAKDAGSLVVSGKEVMVDTLSEALPDKTRPLSREEEKYLEQLFSNLLNVPAKATLEGEHLNTTYGRIGAEQHLRRYPGDTLLQHGEGIALKEGMAPGLGAWGYFASNKNDLTPSLEETEKWYAVVQTLYLPDWDIRQPHLKNWYKHRKMLIVNTDNGNAVVASIADSGPAAWTGKHYGGSPEVMYYLGGARYKKGPVIMFFVDDPENKIPLGPVDYNNIRLPASQLESI